MKINAINHNFPLKSFRNTHKIFHKRNLKSKNVPFSKRFIIFVEIFGRLGRDPKSIYLSKKKINEFRTILKHKKERKIIIKYFFWQHNSAIQQYSALKQLLHYIPIFSYNSTCITFLHLSHIVVLVFCQTCIIINLLK